MPDVFYPVRRMTQTQTLGAAYGADLSIPETARGATVTLDDSTIAFVVQDQGPGTPEEAIPAGSSWELGNDMPLSGPVTIKIKAAAGATVAVLAYFLPNVIN